jgi:hypothetical protein
VGAAARHGVSKVAAWGRRREAEARHERGGGAARCERWRHEAKAWHERGGGVGAAARGEGVAPVMAARGWHHGAVRATVAWGSAV